MLSKAFKTLPLLLLFVQIRAFYVPGVAPKEFKQGNDIEVKVSLIIISLIYFLTTCIFKAIKLTSTRTQIPYEFYSVPFCKPTGAIHYKSENLGELLRGDRIVNTALKGLLFSIVALIRHFVLFSFDAR